MRAVWSNRNCPPAPSAVERLAATAAGNVKKDYRISTRPSTGCAWATNVSASSSRRTSCAFSVSAIDAKRIAEPKRERRGTRPSTPSLTLLRGRTPPNDLISLTGGRNKNRNSKPPVLTLRQPLKETRAALRPPAGPPLTGYPDAPVSYPSIRSAIVFASGSGLLPSRSPSL